MNLMKRTVLGVPIAILAMAAIGIGALVNYLSTTYTTEVTTEPPINLVVTEETGFCTQSGDNSFACTMKGGDSIIFKIVRENLANNPVENLIVTGIEGTYGEEIVQALWNYDGGDDWNSHWEDAEIRNYNGKAFITEDGYFNSHNKVYPWHILVPEGMTQDGFKSDFNAHPTKYYTPYGITKIKPDDIDCSTLYNNGNEIYPYETAGTCDDIAHVYSDDCSGEEFCTGDQPVWIEDNPKTDYVKFTFAQNIEPGTYQIKFLVIQPGTSLEEINNLLFSE